MKNNENLKFVEKSIINNALMQSRYVSKINDLINETYSYIINFIYNNDNEKFEYELQNYIQNNQIDFSNKTIDIMEEHIKIINYFAQKYVLELITNKNLNIDRNYSILNMFTLEDISKCFNIQINAEHDMKISYYLKLNRDPLSFLSLLNRHNKMNIKLGDKGEIILKDHSSILQYVMTCDVYDFDNINVLIEKYKDSFYIMNRIYDKITRIFNLK